MKKLKNYYMMVVAILFFIWLLSSMIIPIKNMLTQDNLKTFDYFNGINSLFIFGVFVTYVIPKTLRSKKLEDFNLKVGNNKGGCSSCKNKK